MYDCRKYSAYTGYSKLFHEFFKDNQTGCTYSEIAKDVFNQNIDWFYEQLDKGLTVEQYTLAKAYMQNYKPIQLSIDKMCISGCFDMITEGVERLKKDWITNITQRYYGQPETMSKLAIRCMVYNHLGFEYAGMDRKEIKKWLDDLEKSTVAKLKEDEE